MKYKKIILSVITIVVSMSILTHKVEALNDNQINSMKKFIQTQNVVLLGDSLFDYYDTDEVFNGLPVINSGVAGETATDALNDIEKRLYRYNPTKVFILVGINDLYKYKNDYTQKEVVKKVTHNIDEIVKETRKYRPKCKIYLISLFPINEDKYKYATKDYDKHIINGINNYLEINYLGDNMISYIDAHSKLQDEDGNFKDEYTDDGIHPNDLGYEVFTEILDKYLYE